MNENTLTLTITEVAAQLRISRGLAYSLAREGKIPTLRLGRRLLVPRKALEDLLGQWQPPDGRGDAP